MCPNGAAKPPGGRSRPLREPHPLDYLELAPAQVREVFERAVAAYRERGISATRPEIVHTERAGGRLLLVTVRWPYLDAAGASKGSEVSRYVVWLDRDGEPRIRVGMPWS
jgi:hypothetical protein